MQPVFRFAPSPNGRLHRGHAYSACLNAALAARLGGRFLVRLEDIDPTRCTETLARQCLEDLAWLGLRWEEPVRTQSRCMEEYSAALDALRARGLLYPCFCTRKEVAEAALGFDPDGAPLYSGRCRALDEWQVDRRLGLGERHAWRVCMVDAVREAGPLSYHRFDAITLAEEAVSAEPARWGDVVLARKEVPTSYHLSVTLDDAMQGITHVVRGADLEASTDLHRLLQALLGLPSPLYYHHALIRTDGGEKLAKSRGAESLSDLRELGVTPAELRSGCGLA